MKTLFIKRTLARSIGDALAGGMVLLMVGMLPQQAVAGIASTKHNLGTTGTGPNTFSGTGRICVFCHTPHGANTSASVPLWNRNLANPSTYTTYNSLGTSSLDGAVAPVGSVSIACLSCHDGTQALNVMLNAPGSGTAGDAAFKAGTWTGPALTATPVGSLNYSTPSIVDIGVDLRNDHPVGIQYGGGGETSAAPTATLNDATDFNPTTTALLNGQQVWWVDTGGSGRQKTDLMLFTRSVAGIDGGAAQPFVECGSCHDPHTSVNPTFLRISDTGSALCLACHIK